MILKPHLPFEFRSSYIFNFLIVNYIEAINGKFELTESQLKSAWKRVLTSINSLGRALARKQAQKNVLEELLARLNRAIGLVMDDKIDKALGVFYLIRDNLEDMANPTQSNSDSDDDEEDSSDSDGDD